LPPKGGIQNEASGFKAPFRGVGGLYFYAGNYLVFKLVCLLMDTSNIRNFCIIAHIDHGKSTLADRLLEVTGTIEKRKMKEQVLDQMELERERGITIKMQPVRMVYHPQFPIINNQFPINSQCSSPNVQCESLKIENLKLKISESKQEFVLNLIDTPGHIDFNYEVSRALKAVEGAILLVDATQGVQAQTITNVEMAKALGLTILPVLNKIDLPTAMVKETKEEIVKLINCSEEEILAVSAKTGEGVDKLLEEIVKRVPVPKFEFADASRALVFDFEYSNHQGIILYVRMFDGRVKKGDKLRLSQVKENFTAGEIGTFSPAKTAKEELRAGDIGYIVTNIKRPSVGAVGDTVLEENSQIHPLGGYKQPQPVVWASIYPESQDDFNELQKSLERLRLSDSSISYEYESGGALGKGFRCGFLGLLHLEIITERLRREFGMSMVIASPTISYRVQFNDGREENIYSPIYFPDDHLIKKVFEPWVTVQIVCPPDRIGAVMQVLYEHEAEGGDTEQFGDLRTLISVKMPLRELMRNFFDELKSATSGYASLNYKFLEMRESANKDITRLDVLIADEIMPAFSRIVSRGRLQLEADSIVEKLKDVLPRQLFVVKIQAVGLGRILASRSLSALQKNVTAHMYGGDRTRKMKLWAKQKRGKQRMKAEGKVNIPHEVFVKMMQR